MTKFQKIIIALVGGLVVLIAVVGFVLVKGQADAQRQVDYERCLALYGFTPEDPATTRDELGELAAAAEACSD